MLKNQFFEFDNLWMPQIDWYDRAFGVEAPLEQLVKFVHVLTGCDITAKLCRLLGRLGFVAVVEIRSQEVVEALDTVLEQ